MNSDLSNTAVQKLTAQIGEALFGQPGLNLMEIADKVRSSRSLLSDADVLEVVARYVGKTSAAYRYIAEDLATRQASNMDDAQPSPAGQAAGMSADDFANMVESEAGEYGEMLGDGAPYSGWVFSCEALIGFCGAIINGWGFELRAQQAALAASQPVGQAPTMFQVRPRSSPDGEGWREVSKREYDDRGEFPGYPETEWERRALYAAPPAQPVDLGAAIDLMWTWQEQLGGHVYDVRDVARTLTTPDMQAIGVDPMAVEFAENRGAAIVLAKQEILRALIDSQAVKP